MMFQWLRQKLCKHDYELVSQITYIAEEAIYDLDKADDYMCYFTEQVYICTKCGHKQILNTRMK
jgi:hypothetical protein